MSLGSGMNTFVDGRVHYCCWASWLCLGIEDRGGVDGDCLLVVFGKSSGKVGERNDLYSTREQKLERKGLASASADHWEQRDRAADDKMKLSSEEQSV